MPTEKHHSDRPGKRNLERIASNPQAHEKALELLKSIDPYAFGTIAAQNSRTAAKNLWEFFSEKYLRKDPSQGPPEVKDLLQFIAMIPTCVKGMHKLDGTTTMSLSSLKRWLQATLEHFEIIFNWQPPPSARYSLGSLLQTMETNGDVTRMPRRHKQWISAELISHMTYALFQEALTNGTTSWDLTIAKSLSLSVQCVTGARAGDLVKANGCADDMVVKLKDFVIKVVTSPDGVFFRARLVLRFTKGKKHDPCRNHVIAIQSSLDPKLNTTDPIKLVLLLGLRTGALQARSIQEVINTALTKQDGLVQWAQPEWPLHPAFESNASAVISSSPTTGSQLGHTLNEAAKLTGINEPLIPHDIRRGAARDMYRLPSLSIAGSSAAQTLLDHSESSLRSGVTDEYVNEPVDSRWEERANSVSDPQWDPRPRLKRPRLEANDFFMDGFTGFEDDSEDSDTESDDIDGVAISSNRSINDGDERLAPLDLRSLDFIEFFSRINSTTAFHSRRNASKHTGKANDTDIGNTRAIPTAFKLRCKNFSNCGMDFETFVEHERHQMSCTPENTLKKAHLGIT
ncbi:hypothetical protein QM012_002045 [Aureobasidium pullulans]|uniref:Uncharacterized protein n=1 Tax=Aureobasidium pullulans TaxID=5580 RepID=A0ABR0TE29_AURPU